MAELISVRQVDTDWQRVAYLLEFDEASISAETIFRYLTTPALLQTWWAEEAIVEPQIGGNYQMAWPSIDKRLLGRITNFEPNRAIAFTWLWEDGSEGREKLVEISIIGNTVALTHSGYDQSEADQQARQDHIDGWAYFLSLLQAELLRQATENSAD